MCAMIEMKFKPGALVSFGLPDILYPVPIETLSRMIEGGDMPLPAMLYGLQQQSASGDVDWHALEPALDRLAELLTPEDDRECVTAAAKEWWVEIGPVNLDEPIVTIQRQGLLIAALAKRDDGRLRLATFRPLDANSAAYIIDLCLRAHHKTGQVCMRENNWEYALDSSARTGNWYASHRGEAHLSSWELGIGRMRDGSTDKLWHAMRRLRRRRSAKVAMELGAAYAFSN